MAGKELEAARRFWHDTLDQVMASLHEAQTARQAVPGGGIPAWSEADTVLFLHEYLAQTYDYDTAGGNFDAFSLFRDGVESVRRMRWHSWRWGVRRGWRWTW